MKKKKVLNVPEQVLVDDYKIIKNIYKLGKKYGITAATVSEILKKNGASRTPSEAAKQRDNKHLGRYKRTPEVRQKLREYRLKLPKEKHPCYGKPKSDETRNRIRQALSKRIGKLNANFKHGKNIRRPRDFKIHEMKPVRNRVFNRDKHTCHYCKQKGGHLHAHHIIPYWVCPEAFLDDTNLITVCTLCHFNKAHNRNWATFDASLLTEDLIIKYALSRERLNELATLHSRCNSLNSRNI